VLLTLLCGELHTMSARTTHFTAQNQKSRLCHEHCKTVRLEKSLRRIDSYVDTLHTYGSRGVTPRHELRQLTFH
jgi:hypothetical protein